MLNLTAIFEKAEDGGYVCWCEEIPEAMSQGESIPEAKENLIDALKCILQYRHEQATNQVQALKSQKISVTTESIPLTAMG